MSKSIRVPSTTVELVQILGEILRTNLRFRVVETECWTLDNIANWDNGWYLHHPERREQLYFASGHCLVRPDKPGNPEHIQLRATCQHDDWDAAGLRAWIVKIWIRRADGSTQRYFFFGGTDEGASRGMYLFEDEYVKENPPKRLSFKVT